MQDTMVLAFSDDLISHHDGFFYREKKIVGTSVNKPYTICTLCRKYLQLLFCVYQPKNIWVHSTHAVYSFSIC